MSARSRVVVYMVLLFVIGAGAGFAGGIFYHKARLRAAWRAFSPKKYETHLVDQLTKELSLTPEQQKTLGSVLDRRRESMTYLWKDGFRRYQAVRDTSRNEIRAMLTDEQRAKYEAWLEAACKKFKYRR